MCSHAVKLRTGSHCKDTKSSPLRSGGFEILNETNESLRGDIFVCHVTGAQEKNLVCFAVGRPIKKYGRVCYL